MDVSHLLDPELAELAAWSAAPEATTPEEMARGARRRMQEMADQQPAPPPREGVVREELSVPGPPGDPDVAIRLFRRADHVGPTSAFVHMHGGGYVAGSYDMDTPRMDALVARHGCVGVSVEYRLAPETPYPGPLEDCFAALSYVHDNADDLGVDPSRVSIGGGSAGAGLAAGLALLARDRGVPVAHQHLIYPMLDDRQITPSSQWIVPVWNRETNALGWRAYLGDLYGTDDVPAYAAPARADDLSGLPPAYLHVGTLDGFLHENIDYASRLLAAGVPVELHVFPGAPHGFDNLGGTASVSRAAMDASLDALARMLDG